MDDNVHILSTYKDEIYKKCRGGPNMFILGEFDFNSLFSINSTNVFHMEGCCTKVTSRL